jgi:hypothetical protein
VLHDPDQSSAVNQILNANAPGQAGRIATKRRQLIVDKKTSGPYNQRKRRKLPQLLNPTVVCRLDKYPSAQGPRSPGAEGRI